ncbi:MAG: phosphosulfolactate synthase [Rhodospirillales bacterium]
MTAQYKPTMPFLEVPPGTPKPRNTSFTVLSDFGALPVTYIEEMLDVIGDMVDWVKFSDHIGTMNRLGPERQKMRTAAYKNKGVPVLPGGIPFELAYLQKKVEPLYEALIELGFDGVEVSADSIRPIPRDERSALIQLARKKKIQVFTEVGDKIGDEIITAQPMIDTIKADIDAGALKVSIENNELCNIFNDGDIDAEGHKALDDVITAVGLESVGFEVGPKGWPDVPVWLVNTYGSGINIVNIWHDQVMAMEGMRRGISRPIGYKFFRELLAREDSSE